MIQRALLRETFDVATLSTLFAAGGVGPVEVIGASLERIARNNPALGAMVHVADASARGEAEESQARWESGKPNSLIDGVPLAIKANIAVRGLLWTAGMGAYRDRVAEEDATVIDRLHRAGALIVGMTNMDEAALGASTDNHWFGRTQNPVSTGHSAGGSSGGSAAAVAAGFAAAALGTDTLGSIRIPASYCGLVGHKPARGKLLTAGVEPLARSLDTVGLLTRSVADCRLLMDILAPQCGEPKIIDLRRLAVLDLRSVEILDPALESSFAALVGRARRLGVVVDYVSFDGLSLARLQLLLLMITEIEGARAHAALIAAQPDNFSPRLLAMFQWGASIDETLEAEFRQELATSLARIEVTLDGYDALLLPATPQAAFAFDGPVPGNQAMFTAIASGLGWPATAFPIGTTDAGLPIGGQVISTSDALCLQLAEALMFG